MSQLNISVEVLQESDIQKRLGAEKFVGGIKYCDDASVNPVALTQEIFEATKKKSAHFEVFENSEVFSIEEQGGDKRILSAKAEVSAPIVIYATNAYSSLLQNYFSDKIFPTRGQILVTEPVPYFMEGPCYANFVLDYFRQLPSGEMLIGGFRQLQKDAELGYADIISDVIQEALEKFLETHIPAVRGKKITHRWSGIMGFSSDGQPMVGSLPNDNQSFFTGGFTAHGLGLAFHAGKTLVDLMFEREIPEFISAKRFN